MYRGAVRSAIHGKRGQAFLREMLAALDAMPEKRLIAHDLVAEPPAFMPPGVTPMVCAIGAVGVARGVNMTDIDPEDRDLVADTFGIARALAAEIVYENDESYWSYNETPERRWQRMRQWVAAQLREPSV